MTVPVYKTFKYRVYPDEAQEQRLLSWENTLRFLWNLALEQHLMGMRRCKGEKVYPTAFDQIKQLKHLRAEHDWIRDVPRDVATQTLMTLEKAWKRCFKGVSKAPRFKKKGRHRMAMTEPRACKLEGSRLQFPKVGRMKIVVHRPFEGKMKSVTIVRDADHWYACLLSEVEHGAPGLSDERSIGIDRGITYFAADSDGRLIKSPRPLKRSLEQLRRAHKKLSRKKKGSANFLKQKKKLARLHRRVRQQRRHFLHELSTFYARNYSRVVIEDLRVRNMIRNPFLARHIADAGWSQFRGMLAYKLEWNGGELIEVEPAYTSQTCSVCGYTDEASRDGEDFFCTSCGFYSQADLNAATIILGRGNASALPVEGSCVGIPVKQESPSGQALRGSLL